ncbi:MFS transporter [Micrococcales bacterium 31B]|nr:MFS transporter [Micrococcales bacterium 31B]
MVDSFRSAAAPRKSLLAWWLWDSGGAAFSAVIISFVFSQYITQAVASTPDEGTTAIGTANTIAAVVIALLAPLLGTLADAGQYRKRLLICFTLGTVTCSFLLFGIEADKSDPRYLIMGAAIMALGGCFLELSGVFYNSMLPQLATRANVGRVSGVGMAFGYGGGVVCLVLTLFVFVNPAIPGLALPEENGLNFRAIAIFCGIWLLACATPLMLTAPRQTLLGETTSWNPWQGYVQIARQIRQMWREDRLSLHFFIASAIVRDSLAAIFALAGVIAGSVYNWSAQQTIIFALLANVAAALGATFGGRLDDRLGPKSVVIGSTSIMIVSGLLIVTLNTSTMFFAAGLVIAALVGPSQSAMRTLLTRVTPPGRENANFGLYATTGRALSFLGHGSFTLFTVLFSGSRWGMLGIVSVMALGLIVFIPLKYQHQRAVPSPAGQA